MASPPTRQRYCGFFSTDAFDYALRLLRLRILNAWKVHAPVSPPGSAFQYANLGYIIAGAMIEKASGRPWEEMITKRIYAPLGLKTAGLGPQATMGELDAPVGHQVDEKGRITPMLMGAAADGPPVVKPAGIAHMSVLISPPGAAGMPARAKRGSALVKPETLARLHRSVIKTGKMPDARPGTRQEGEYALGWGVVKFAWAPQPLLTHNGSNGLNLATILIDTEADLGIVAVTSFPGQKANDSVYEVIEGLYQAYAK